MSLEKKLHKARERDDPLLGTPTPEEPEKDFVKDSDEERVKPVLNVTNKRVGGG